MIALALVSLLGAFEPDPLLPGKPYVLRGHTEAVISLAFTPDGTQLASAARDKTIKLWNLKTGELVRTITGAEQQVSSIAFSGDGKKLAAGDLGLLVRVLDPATGAALQSIAHPDVVGEVSLNADGSLLAVAGVTDNGTVYELPKGTRKFDFRGRTARFSADGKTLLVSSSSNSFSLLDVKTGKARKTVNVKNELPLATMNAKGSTIASWTTEGVDVHLWSDAARELTVLKGPAPEMDRQRARVTGVAVLADGKRVISGGGDGLVRLWSVEKAAVIQAWPTESAVLAVSPDGTWLAVGDSALVKLWKIP